MVYIKKDFQNDPHGKLPCTACHRGNSKTEIKENAHENLVALPSDNPKEFCGGCHGAIVSKYENSLHAGLNGYHQRIETRWGQSIKNDENIMQKFNAECGKCHASCGQCHISRPVSVHGGFINGHSFMKTPTSKNNCTACHGSRVGAEYFGENEGVRSDVHWIPNVKQCVFCHTGSEMHGTGHEFEHRYQEAGMPRCENCHQDSVNTENVYHQMHGTSGLLPKLACQVCHSQPYKNCNGCHTGGAGITGESYMSFKIAKNYLKGTDYNREYDYIVVRHIPIVRDTYSSWGITDLPNFDAEPTWKYTTPHNIQRWTPQTDTTGVTSCSDNCHNTKYFLTADDIKPFDGNANDAILMDQ